MFNNRWLTFLISYRAKGQDSPTKNISKGHLLLGCLGFGNLVEERLPDQAMDPLRKEGLTEGDGAEGSDRADRPLDGDATGESGAICGTGSSGPSDAAQRGRRISERLRDVLRGESDGDLLLERGEGESGVLQWLRALDLQVLGACRADERLKPLLKLNVSSGIAEERLMAQLNQHFEATEIGMLAMCLCVPLVSIRVGKVNKKGNLLYPTPARGQLNLSLLPSSNLRISFTGDDGCIERLAVVATDSESSSVTIEEISADSSGRSFQLKCPGSQVSYFWCSEKSKFHGMELLAQMKDLLRKKPTLSHLTGICESRLDSFANHLRAFLLGSSDLPEATSSTSSLMVTSSLHASDFDVHSSTKSSRVRVTAAHSGKTHPFYQGSLSPRSSTFKDGMLKSSLANRNGSREKHKRRGDGFSSSLTINNQSVTSVSTSCTAHALFMSQHEDENSVNNVLKSSEHCCSLPRCLHEVPCLSSPLFSCSPLAVNAHPSQFAIPGSTISPYYCWCPPCPSPLQYTVSSHHMPMPFTESLPLPPLSSLLSSERPSASIISPELPIDVAELPSFKLPSLFPETLVCLPLPGSSHVALPSSQQIPTFTPFMSDSVVHIPIIDVCSAGQGYLVSTEPTISIAPLLPTRASPLIPETESVLEKSARETLRMLMASAPASTCPQLMTMLPEVLSRSAEKLPCSQVSKLGPVVAGSRGFYSGTMDVKAATSGMFFMELPLLRQELAHGCGTTGDEHGDLEGKDSSIRPRVSEGSSCSKDDDLLHQ